MKEIKKVCHNGLKIHVMENDVLTKEEYFALICQSGSQHDSKYCGTAHFIEHMLLDGAKRILEQNSKEYFVQGKTGVDRTILYLSCKSTYKAIKCIFEIFHDIIYGRNLDKNIIEEIRNNLLSEYNHRVIDNPFFEMYQEVLAFSGISECMPIGKKNDIKAINFEDLERYFFTNYRADNLVLLCSTNLEIRQVYSIFIDVFSSKKNNIKSKNEIYVPDFVNRRKEFSLRKINGQSNSVHIFFNRSEVQNNLKNDFIQSIIFTMFDEISNEYFQGNIISTEYKILHFTKKNRFMYFTFVMKNALDNIKYELEKFFFIRCQKEIEKLIKDIIDFYKEMIINEEQLPNNQLNRMIESYLFNVPIYEKEDIVRMLEALNTKEVISEWENIHYQLLNCKDIYLYQFVK